jgi:hypothetical protein
MKWALWRLQVTIDLMERYQFSFVAAWRKARDFRDLFDQGHPPSSSVCDD